MQDKSAMLYYNGKKQTATSDKKFPNINPARNSIINQVTQTTQGDLASALVRPCFGWCAGLTILLLALRESSSCGRCLQNLPKLHSPRKPHTWIRNECTCITYMYACKESVRVYTHVSTIGFAIEGPEGVITSHIHESYWRSHFISTSVKKGSGQL